MLCMNSNAAFHSETTRSRYLVRGVLLFTVCFAAITNLVHAKKSSVVTLTPENFKELVIDSQETWLVEFYAPWCGHCKALAPEWEAAASKLDGVVKLGAVDADKHRNLGSKYGIRGFPTIKVFKGVGNKARRPSDYQGERKARAIVDYAKSVLPSFSAVIKASGLDAFFEEEPNLPHAVLFTDKNRTPPMLKALSAKHFGKVSLGEIRKSELNKMKKAFVDAAHVEDFPTLMIFPPGSSDPSAAERISGEIKPAALAEHIERVALSASPNENASGDAKEEKQSAAKSEKVETGEKVTSESADSGAKGGEDGEKRVFSQPKVHETQVFEVSSSGELERECFDRMDGSICVLELVRASGYQQKGESYQQQLDEVRAKYRYDKLVFAQVQLTTMPEEAGSALVAALGVEHGDDHVICAVRPRKRRAAVMASALEEEEEGGDAAFVKKYEAFLDRVVGGDARYHKIADSVPQWSAAGEKDANENEPDTQCTAQSGGGDSAGASSCKAEL